MAAKLVKPSIMARTEDGSPVVEVFAFEYKDGKLVMDCKALGSMRMDVIIAPEDLAKGWSIVKKDRGKNITCPSDSCRAGRYEGGCR